MRRLLVLLTLMVAVLAPQTAMAESFSFGPAGIFDTNKAVTDSLNELNAAYGNAVFGNAPAFAPQATYTVTGLGYSNYAATLGLQLRENNTNIAGTHLDFRPTGEYAPEDLFLAYFNMLEMRQEDLPLSNLSPVAYVESGKLEYYMPGDLTPYLFEAGTYIFAFAIPGSGNQVDFVMALSPSSAVPVPAAVWLLGSGLAGIAAVRRKLK